jgi:hypothetical protein
MFRFWKYRIRLHSLPGALLVALLLSSCVTTPDKTSIRAVAQLPSEVVMDSYAGLGGRLFVTVHLEKGPEFRCLVDTGSPWSLLPGSLEGQLGKRIARIKTSTSMDDPKQTVNIYNSPTLYLGDVPLVMGKEIGVWDGSVGILGMDFLRNYCIQLDFQARKIRFLAAQRTNTADLGKAFALLNSPYADIRHPGLFDRKQSELLIDTGYAIDGRLDPKVFKDVVYDRNAQLVPIKITGEITNKSRVPKLVLVPATIWETETYTNLIVDEGHPALIGLRFLGRHLVTFDFPNRMMYLKRVEPDMAAKQNVLPHGDLTE